MSVITFNGMLQYDETLFDDIVMPEGLDKDVMVRTINQRSGDLLCYYDEPTHFKALITDWFNVIYKPNIERMLRVLNEEYNPIYNYNRIDNFSDQNYHTDSVVVDSDIGVDTTTTNDTSAYDSSTYSPSEKKVVGEDQTIDSTTTTNGNYTITHNGSSMGNIGITSSQKLVKDEMDVRLKYNIYDVVASAFEKEFLIQVY